MRTRSGTIAAALLALTLAACGGGLKGTFEDELGMTRLTFQGGGRVVQASPLTAVEVEMRYEVDGDKVRLLHPEAGAGAALVLTRIDDDTLSGPMGLRYARLR